MGNASQTRPPVVILARPQMGENIGAAARAMMNCGLSDLRLVAPRDGWPNAAALPMAAGGKPIIETAQVCDPVAAARIMVDNPTVRQTVPSGTQNTIHTRVMAPVTGCSATASRIRTL